jgi:hypothetical protein
LSEAETEIVTFPATVPAVKVVVVPVELERLPNELLMVHRYVTVPGQLPGEHVGVATKVADPPVFTETSIGLTVTSVSSTTVADTVIGTGLAGWVRPLNEALR